MTNEVVDYATRRARGIELYREVMGQEPPELTTPRAATLIDFVYAEIWSRPGLTRRERRLITLACCAGADADQSVADHVYGALASGDLSHDELHEVVLQFSVYCGWAKGEVFDRIVEEQWRRLNAARGTPAPARPVEPLTSVSADQDQRARDGEHEFAVVNLVPAPPRGVPYFEAGILNFVFGDMWRRPGLSRRDRRFVTLACVGLDDAQTPIRSHFQAALQSGDITLAELHEVVLQFAAYSGWPKGSFVQQVVFEVAAETPP